MLTCRRCNRELVPVGLPTGNRSRVAVGSHGKVRQGPRKLCATCYRWARRNGTVRDYPTYKCVRADDFLEERSFLMEQGLTDRQVCEKFGYKWDSYTRKLQRAGIRHGVDR